MAGDKGDNKTVNEKMTAIADNIRDKTGGTDPLTLDDMASGINEVYETGALSGIVKMTEEEFNKLEVKDEDTFYLVY